MLWKLAILDNNKRFNRFIRCPFIRDHFKAHLSKLSKADFSAQAYFLRQSSGKAIAWRKFWPWMHWFSDARAQRLEIFHFRFSNINVWILYKYFLSFIWWLDQRLTKRIYSVQTVAKSSPYFCPKYVVPVRWRFGKILWPSQNIWTLLC